MHPSTMAAAVIPHGRHGTPLPAPLHATISQNVAQQDYIIKTKTILIILNQVIVTYLTIIPTMLIQMVIITTIILIIIETITKMVTIITILITIIQKIQTILAIIIIITRIGNKITKKIIIRIPQITIIPI